jgi:hypothetical protein
MKLQTVHPIETGKISDALSAISGLGKSDLEQLGATLFSDAINHRTPLPQVASQVRNVAGQLSWADKQALIKGFFGTEDQNVAGQMVHTFERLVQSMKTRQDGVVELELKNDHFLGIGSSDRQALADRLDGKPAVFVRRDGEILFSGTGNKAPHLSAEKKKKVLAELEKRFAGVRGIEVKGGVLSITAGNAFDGFQENLSRFVHKFVGDVPWKVTRDTKGDNPVLEISKSGVVTSWVDGKARVPLLSYEQGRSAAKALGDDRIYGLTTGQGDRYLALALAPETTKTEARQIMKRVAKELGADAISSYASQGLGSVYGEPPGKELWHLAEADAGVAAKKAQKLDPGVQSVGLGTADAEWRLGARTFVGGKGNALVISVSDEFDFANADKVRDAIAKSLELDDKVPIGIYREQGASLATIGVLPQKDSYAGLRDEK